MDYGALNEDGKTDGVSGEHYDAAVYSKAVDYLNTEPFKHLSSLKYLTLYKDKLTGVELLEENGLWAVRVTLPTSFLSYDTLHYPGAREAVFVNGTSDPLRYRLLETLPEKPYVIRLNEELDLTGLKSSYEINPGHTYISYSRNKPEGVLPELLPPQKELTSQAVGLFQQNSYSGEDLKKYFNNGSVWFGILEEEKLKSACFVYKNYESIWEIAGVRTLSDEQGKGYGRKVVIAALNYLHNKNQTPRYEAEIRNNPSLNLAQSLGLQEFLRIRHFLLEPRDRGQGA